MNPIWFLVGALFVADLWLAYFLWRERIQHRFTRAALKFWQRESRLPRP